MTMTVGDKIIHELYQISLDHNSGFGPQVTRMLDLGLDIFGLDIGILSQIQAEDYLVLYCLHQGDLSLVDGARFEVGRTYCALTVAAAGPVGLDCVGDSEHHTHPAYLDFQLESYLGTPVYVGGKVFGTLNFSSLTARDREFEQADFDAVQLMAAWLGSELGRLQKEEQLRRAEERFRLALDASPGAMVIMDQSGDIAHVNIEALGLFDYSYEQIIGKPIDVLLPAAICNFPRVAQDDGLEQSVSRAMEAGKELTACDSKGNGFPVEVGINPLEMPEGTFVLCAITDLTERKRHEATILAQARQLQLVNLELAQQATIDSLTGLLNRRGFSDQMATVLKIARRSGRPTSLLMIDIDHFKDFNDTLGHGAGDQALSVVAGTIQKLARTSDLVCRYGGEEFVVLLPETSQSGADVLAERICTAVSSIHTLPIPVTISIGSATIGGGSHSASVADIERDLLERADAALYRAKDQGRNQVVRCAGA